MTTHFFEGLEPPTVDTVEANILHIPYTTQWEPFIFWAASQLVPSFKIWTLVIFKPTRRHWNKQWPTLAREMFRASWNFSLKKHLTQTVLKCITPMCTSSYLDIARWCCNFSESPVLRVSSLCSPVRHMQKSPCSGTCRRPARATF